MSDPHRVGLRLCDEDGMVSHKKALVPEGGIDSGETYIDRLNRLKSLFAPNYPDTHYDGDPFPCTGSATFPGVTAVCDNPVHCR